MLRHHHQKAHLRNKFQMDSLEDQKIEIGSPEMEEKCVQFTSILKIRFHWASEWVCVRIDAKFDDDAVTPQKLVQNPCSESSFV